MRRTDRQTDRHDRKCRTGDIRLDFREKTLRRFGKRNSYIE